MKIIEQLMQNIWDAGNAIAAPVLSLPTQSMLWTGLIPLVLWLVGIKLSKVVKAESPYLSPILRSIGSVAKWVGLILIAFELLGFVALLVLLSLHQTLSGLNASDAIKQAWEIVYCCLGKLTQGKYHRSNAQHFACSRQ